MSRIVVDSNFAGRGHFDQTRLKWLATMVGTDAEFVVPEVVVWEWAEHAYASFASILGQRQAFKVDPRLIELPAFPALPTSDDLCQQIKQALPACFRVCSLSGDDHVLALKAQVLQLGAGEKKEGVKTGAADHLIYLCVRDQFYERHATEPVIAATADKQLRALCEAEFGGEVLCAKDDRELLSRLEEFVPAEEDLLLAVQEELRWQITANTDIGRALDRFSMGFTIVNRPGPPEVWEDERLGLRQVDLVEVDELEVGERRENGRRIGSASIRIFGSISIQLFTYEADLGVMVLISEGISRAIVDVPLAVIFDRDWAIASVEPAGVAAIDFDT